MDSLDSKETPGKRGKTMCLKQRHLSMGYFECFFFPWGTCGSVWISSASVDAQYYLWQIREIIVSEQ